MASSSPFGPGSSVSFPDAALYVQGVKVQGPEQVIDVPTRQPAVYGFSSPDVRVELATELGPWGEPALSDSSGYWVVPQTSQTIGPGVHSLFMTTSDRGGQTHGPGLVATFRVPTKVVIPKLQREPPETSLRDLNYLTIPAMLFGCGLVIACTYAFVWRAYRKDKAPGDGLPADDASLRDDPRRLSFIRLLRKRRVLLLAFTLALALRVVLAVPLVHDWDGFVFRETAVNLLRGETPYETAAKNSPEIYPDSDQPMTEQWYAYPPLPALMFTASYWVVQAVGVTMTELVSNFALKIPFILGDLLLGWLVWKLLIEAGASERRANRACILALLNPFLIWISSAWGMFDVWMANFLLLFLLAERRGRYGWAGTWLGLACLVKLFPLFFLPVIGAYLWARTDSARPRLRTVAAGLATILAVSIPFLLSSPRGFLNQTFIMHLIRPPQGIGITGMLDFLGNIYDWKVPSFAYHALSVLTLGTVVVLSWWGMHYVRDRADRLLTVMVMIFSALLIGNKVVNEQYFVVLIVLLLVLHEWPAGRGSILSQRQLGWAEGIVTVGVGVAAVVLGFHFLTFLPARLAEGRAGGSTEELVYFLSDLIRLPRYTYPNSVMTYYNAPQAAAYVAVLPVLGFLAFFAAKGLAAAVADRQVLLGGMRRALPTLGCLPRVARRYWLPSVAIVVVVAMTGGYLRANDAFRPLTLDQTPQTGTSVSPRMVGTFYYLWWKNPNHQKDYPGDAWAKTSESPDTGFYTTKNSYIAQHVKQMQKANIDFALVSYHLYERARFKLFTGQADAMGFDYAPLIETDDALNDERFHQVDPAGVPGFGFSPSPEAQDRVVEVILSSVPKSGPGPGWLRVDGRPAISVYDGHFYFPSWDADSKKRLAGHLLERSAARGPDPFAELSARWGVPVGSLDDLIDRYPVNEHAFNTGTGPVEVDYREAFLSYYQEYWAGIRSRIEARIGPVYLLSTSPGPQPIERDKMVTTGNLEGLRIFDNLFNYSLSNTWVYWRSLAPADRVIELWRQQIADHGTRARLASRINIQTVTAKYDDRVFRKELGFTIPKEIAGRRTYDLGWEYAVESSPDMVLVSTWNEFFEGSAVEPTREHGGAYLDATTEWAARFKRGGWSPSLLMEQAVPANAPPPARLVEGAPPDAVAPLGTDPSEATVTAAVAGPGIAAAPAPFAPPPTPGRPEDELPGPDPGGLPLAVTE